MRFGNETLSTRKGNVIHLEELLDEGKERAYEVVQQKNPSLSEEEKQHIAEVVGIGAIKYADLSQNIASLLNRGGINSMFFTLTIVILALSLGGLLFGLGIIPTLLDSMAHLLVSPSRATICVVLTALGVNYIVGEQYLSILLAGKTFKPIYDKLELHSKNLSRTLEDAGTVVNPLVPWGVCGVFITSVLGVSTLTYLPFAFFCYLCVILTIISGFTGISISKK